MTEEERILRITEKEWLAIVDLIDECGVSTVNDVVGAIPPSFFEKYWHEPLPEYPEEGTDAIHFDDLEPAPPKDWLPVCASAIDVADTCKNCPYRAQCKKLSDEMDEACGIAKERENDG